MDSIFEDGADEIGGEIEAYCPAPRCKTDTTHTITNMYEDEVRRVQCMVCGEVHAYRKPRGDGEAADGDGTGKKSGPKRVSWEEALARATDTDLANARPYSVRDSYEEGDVVLHPTFDLGFVIDQLPDNCVAMVFRGSPEPKKLIHNRGIEFAARMPEIAEVPVPRENRKKRRIKKPETPTTPIPVRNKTEIEAAIQRGREAARARIEEASRTVDERTSKLKAEVKKGKSAKAAPKPAPVKSAPESGSAKKQPEKKQPEKRPSAKPASSKAGKKPAAKKLAAKKLAPKKPAKAAKPAKATKKKKK